MTKWDVSSLPLRHEHLFGDRVVTCRTDRPAGFYPMFADAVARAPDREALVAGDRRFTWGQLGRIVAETAAGLAGIGIKPGDRVALVVGNRAEFPILLFAIARCGAIAVPISTREQAPGIAYITGHCGALLLIHEAAFADRMPQSKDLPDATRCHAITDDGELLGGLRSAEVSAPVERDEQDIALILYTSGTTGKPKGAMLADINIVHGVMIYEHVMDLRDGEREVVAVPMSHVTGITGAVALMTRCAGTMIIMEEFKAPDFLVLASRECMTMAVLVPAMYALFLARADFADYDLGSWRVGGYGGAPMPAPVIEGLNKNLPNLGLFNLYGATETVCAQAIMPPEYAVEHRLDVGLAVPGAEVLIMDDQGRECTPGEPGEIWMRNATVIPGYWDNPDATRENIVGGFWRSGDLGQADEEGFIRVLDRIKDMINRGGYKIFTAEVESVLAGHPRVLEAAVVAKPCPILGERVHAFVALREGSLDEDDLSAFCAARLADYKRPESYTIMTRPLPRNANGKLLKREMREMLIRA